MNPDINISTNLSLGEKLKKVRNDAGISRAELVALLKKNGLDIKPYTVCKWETGASRPTVEAFLAICDICRVADIRGVFAPKRRLRLYDMPASAGAGNYLEQSGFEVFEADGLVPADADFAIRVSGDSMTPRFVDKQVVFVKKQPDLSIGEIGVFYLGGEVFLKKLGDGCLVSLNPLYAPILIGEDDGFRVFGKVVG